MIRRLVPSLFVVLAAVTVCADDGVLGGLRIGIDGVVELGRWSECRLPAERRPPGRCRLVVRAADPDGQVVSYPGHWSEADGEPLLAHFALGRFDGFDGGTLLEVELETAEGVIESRSFDDVPIHAVRQDVPIIAIVGEPAGFEPYLGAVPDREDWLVLPLESLADLPSTAIGLEALDALVVAGKYAIDADRLAALDEWVHDGGHLVITTGARVEEYRESGFAGVDWIPFTVAAETFAPRDLERIVAFAEQTSAIAMINTVEAARVTPTREGTVLASYRQRPLVARAVHGVGHVTFLAVDLTTNLENPPLANWAGVEALVERLLRTHRTAEGASSGDGDQRLSHSGIGDLSTQLTAARETFDDVHRSSRWTVMGLILLYLVVIGPLDYLFVHRVLGRPEWTWATFPVVVLLATLLGLRSANTTNGDLVRANRIEVIDVDVATESVRGRGFVTLYSPSNRRYGVHGEVRSISGTVSGETTRPRIGWSGNPEDTYGGMYRKGGLRFEPLRYAHGEDRSFENVPIPVWSTKSFRFDWTESGSGTFTADLRDTGTGRLAGTIESGLPVDVDDWFLVYNNRLYRPREVDDERPSLEPGTVWRIDDEAVVPRELRTYLTKTTYRTEEGSREVDQRTITEQSKYDPLSRNPRRLVEIISLYRAAGGRDYTRLENATLDRLDVSDLVSADRALLVGTLPEPYLSVHTGDGPIDRGRADTFLRVLLPVHREPVTGR